MTENFSDLLGLTSSQTKLLFSIQRLIIEKDIFNETDSKKIYAKVHWYKYWLKNINNIFQSTNENFSLVTNEEDIPKYIECISKDLETNTPLYLILLESTFFRPYYDIPGLPDEIKKSIKPSDANEKILDICCKQAALYLGIEEKYVDKFNDSYKAAQKNLTGFWTKIFVGGVIGAILLALSFGYAAPFIAALFTATGLSGAAATAAGLAALGGGAIAVGGFGMAGGLAVLVGGGAILGAGAGSLAVGLCCASPDFTMSQAAKLQVVMKEIVLGSQKDVKLAQQILRGQEETIYNLRKELSEEKLKKDRNEKKIENLEKSIEYLIKTLNNNIDLVRVF